MKIDTPSPNFNDRKKPISLIVLHYTGMESGQAALQRMRDPDAQVSAHYMVDESGKVFQLVNENKRAWHAGVSEWCGETDINSISVGIEIVNGGHDFGLPAYPQKQINAVISLVKEIVVRHNIPPHRIVGHSDVAPGRKEDPGEKFPWAELALAGVSIWPKDLGEAGDPKEQLNTIGYGWLDDMPSVVAAFQRRFRPTSITGELDQETCRLIAAVAQLSDHS